jgi:hypothetical protein
MAEGPSDWKERSVIISYLMTAAQRAFADFQYLLTDNRQLNETSVMFQMPSIIRSTIMSDGYGEILPKQLLM